MNILFFEGSSLLFERLAGMMAQDHRERRVLRVSSLQGIEAVVRSVVPDAVVMDFDSGTTKEEGFRVLRRFKGLFPRKPAIVLCEYPVRQYKEQYRRLGADHVFDRALEVDALLKILESVEKNE